MPPALDLDPEPVTIRQLRNRAFFHKRLDSRPIDLETCQHFTAMLTRVWRGTIKCLGMAVTRQINGRPDQMDVA
jgi:hypothetical protein